RGPHYTVAPRASDRGNQAGPLRPCSSWIIHLPPNLLPRLQRFPRHRGPPDPRAQGRRLGRTARGRL
ncbi:hypothetical protein HispidOSU_025018, partial [Sigmodon hispidus]